MLEFQASHFSAVDDGAERGATLRIPFPPRWRLCIPSNLCRN